VAVVGVGVLGGQVSYHLALLGIAQVLIDPDDVAPANLANQGFAAATVGMKKVTVRAAQAMAMQPVARVRTIPEAVEDVGLGQLAGVDAIATGVDGRAARVRVNEMASRLNVPWVDAAVDGSGRSLLGTVTLYDPRRAEAPCYLCRAGAADVAAIAREGRGPGCPSWRRPNGRVLPPTLQASAFGAVVAGLQAIWLVRLLLDRAADLVGRELVVTCDGAPRTRLVSLRRAARCVFDHRVLRPLATLRAATVGELLDAAAEDLSAPADEIMPYGRPLVLRLRCTGCGRERRLLKLAHACSDDDVRCPCGCGVEMAPVELTDGLDGATARRFAASTWREIGLPAGEIVTARSGERAVHYVVAGEEAERAR
jgi:adenylyltransferase/sulfurtransferase